MVIGQLTRYEIKGTFSTEVKVIGIIVSNKLGLSLSIEQDIGGSGGRLKIPKIWMILRGKLNLKV